MLGAYGNLWNNLNVIIHVYLQNGEIVFFFSIVLLYVMLIRFQKGCFYDTLNKLLFQLMLQNILNQSGVEA